MKSTYTARHAAPEPATTGPRRWRRRVLGIPAPIVAVALALALGGGVAFAAVIFWARAQVAVTVRDVPTITWEPPLATANADGATCTIARSSNGQKLELTIAGYPGGYCEIAAQAKVPGQGANAKVKIVGVDFGTGLTATLVGGSTSSFSPSFSVAQPNFFTENAVINVAGDTLIPVRIRLELPPGATGTGSPVQVNGLQLSPVFD